MTLEDTAELMLSEDYKERFEAEYWQVKLRMEKLHELLVKYENGELDFVPGRKISLLKKQKKAMNSYILVLEQRARTEGIEMMRLR